MSEEIKNTEQQPTNSTPEVNGGQGGEKMFTQEEVNRIVSERLARERTKADPNPVDEREKALNAREARLDCLEYLEGVQIDAKYKAKFMECLDTSDAAKFKATVDKLSEAFGIVITTTTVGTTTAFPPRNMPSDDDAIRRAFKPK